MAVVPATDAASSKTQFWEGENMTVDSRRKLVFLSRDTGTKGQFIIDISDPWKPAVVGFSKNFQGHTNTCLNDCRFLWSVGGTQSAPAPAKSSPAVRGCLGSRLARGGRGMARRRSGGLLGQPERRPAPDRTPA